MCVCILGWSKEHKILKHVLETRYTVSFGYGYTMGFVKNGVELGISHLHSSLVCESLLINKQLPLGR